MEKAICQRRNSILQPSDLRPLTRAFRFLQGIASHQFDKYVPVCDQHSGDLAYVTNATTVITGEINLSQYIQ